MQAHSVHHDAEKEGPRERLAAGSGVQLAARRSSTPVQAIVGLFVLTLCAGQANATTSDLWYYNSTNPARVGSSPSAAQRPHSPHAVPRNHADVSIQVHVQNEARS